MSANVQVRKGGARVIGSGGGGKSGGGSSRTPVESPDSLRNNSYAVVMDIVGNGELFGPKHPMQPLRDVYLDGTPIQNEDGTINFNDVQFEYRVGTQDQSFIPGFPASSNVTSVGTEVSASTPWTQALTNPDLSAVRVSLSANQLVRQIESGDNVGDRVGVVVEYAIDLSTAGGSFQEVLRAAFDGKNVNGYTRTHRIELPVSSAGWTVRVRRITPDATSGAIQDKFSVSAYAQVIDGKFRYPMTALAAIKIDATQFQSIPTRAYHWRGRIVRVPVNYDPETRTYTGIWDGTFKRAWTDNPVWIYYDILLNRLSGLGERIDASMVDRYALYQIGAYCDQLVSDGQGGTEPRFSCNVFIQTQEDALRVLNDLTSIFRGMAYWANGQVVVAADMPSDPIYTYTNANVLESHFNYTGSDLATLKTVALVSWNDPTDFYRSKVEVVEDDIGIARYGVRKTELIAFGCTSRAQAQRAGLYHLYTSRMEGGGVSFSVGLEGVIPNPGDVIHIADRNRAGRAIGGRIRQATGTTVTIDRDTQINPGDTLSVNLPTGTREARTVTLVSDRVVTVSPAFSVVPQAESVWSVDAPDLVAQPVRVISVKEREGIEFTVEGFLHDPRKYSAIDSGARLDPLPVSVVPPRVQTAPTNIVITQHYTFHQGTTRHRAEVSFDAAPYAVEYDVQWRRDNSDWVQTPKTGTRLVELADIYAGDYLVRVRAFNGLGVPSLWGYSVVTTLDGLAGEPPALVGLYTFPELFGIRTDWAYPDTPNIISKVEIRISHTNSFVDSLPLPEVAYPATSFTVGGLGYGTERWFWARLIDKNGLAGPWTPVTTGAGVYGVSSTDATALLEALAGKINAGSLAPGLVEEITEEVADGIEDSLLGYLTGDDGEVPESVLWYAGDDGTQPTFVGTVTVTSAVNEDDYILAKSISVMASRFGENEAYIARVDAARASGDEALAQSIVIQSARIDDTQARILAEEIARVTADSALANSITLLTADLAGTNASVAATASALSTLDGKLQASWQVKTQVRTSDGRVAWTGMAQGASINPDGTVRSEIILAANIIALAAATDGPLIYPFIFDTLNQTAIFNTALIDTLHGNKITVNTLDANRITTASLVAKLLTVDDAYIKTANIQALAVKTGQIDNLAVNTLKIAGNAVTIQGQNSFSGGQVQVLPTPYYVSLAVTLSYAADVTVTVMTSTIDHEGGGLPIASLEHNGSVVRSVPIYSLQYGESPISGNPLYAIFPTSIAQKFSLGAGTHTFRVAFTRGGGGSNFATVPPTIISSMVTFK